ncbi:MAG: tryptophan--tRNA ligase [Clostridia bacterium]|nr:tryptophan--tRNA ligase [Clostridia bacterium]MBQ4085247.1 tryptophan--tRNA ligase [Clostridia bacterium]
MENQNTAPVQEKKKRIFSGIQPTGTLTLGNYIGALRNFPILQDEYDCVYSVVDLHALTVRQDPATLRKACLKLMSLYLAVGLDPEKTLIYFQSHVAQHCELAWILNCYTYMGELSRMTQFKDKSAKHADNINAGLFTYPVLMAADILLYQTDLVPIGADQKQHLELARDIAQRFNAVYGDVFVVPDGYIPKVGARVMSLQEPTRKMSKSDPEETYIAMLDDPDTIRRKLRRAVTDSEAEVRFDPENKPGISNLMSILSTLSGMDMTQIEATFGTGGYGKFKDAVAESVIETLKPIQGRYEQIMKDKAYLQQVMSQSAERAAYVANKTMLKVRKKVGLAALKL